MHLVRIPPFGEVVLTWNSDLDQKVGTEANEIRIETNGKGEDDSAQTKLVQTEGTTSPSLPGYADCLFLVNETRTADDGENKKRKLEDGDVTRRVKPKIDEDTMTEEPSEPGVPCNLKVLAIHKPISFSFPEFGIDVLTEGG
jgi:hypothetical protein